jgi:hypothetical protein
VKRTVLILAVVIGVIGIGLRVLGQNVTEPPATAHRFEVPAYQLAATRSLPSPRLMVAPEINGELSDWPGRTSIDLDRYEAFSFSGEISSSADLSAVIRSGWTEDTLFFAIEVHDDIIVTDSAEVWRDDGVEIALDGLNDREAWGSDDHQYTVVANGFVSDRGDPTTDVVASVLTYEGGYNVEVAIPMAQLVSGVPISGTVMGFTVGLHDDDDGDNWDAYLIWEGTNTSSAPEEFGSLVFTEFLEDRIDALETRIIQLEQQVQELLAILSEFEGLTPP